MRRPTRNLVPAVTAAALLLPSLAFAQTCACSGWSVLAVIALALLVVLIALPLGVLGLIVLALLVARGILRRNSPWMRVGFRGFRVSFIGTTLVAFGVHHVGLLREGHSAAGVVGVIVASSLLYGAYLYSAVTGLRGPTFPGA